jgi:hypothetical protein
MPTHLLASKEGPLNPAAEYRAGYLRALGHLGLTERQGQHLAECLTGRFFAACGQAELQPVIDQVRTLLHRQPMPEPLGVHDVAHT